MSQSLSSRLLYLFVISVVHQFCWTVVTPFHHVSLKNHYSSVSSTSPLTSQGKKTITSSTKNVRSTTRVSPSLTTAAATSSSNDDDDTDKFGFMQRIESIKCVVVGALGGSFGLLPVGLISDVLRNDSFAQFEYNTDIAALSGALFAIVYRYTIREDQNDMLNSGCIGAFVVVRTLSQVTVPSYCTAAPLTCNGNIGYLDYSLLIQFAEYGIESAALFYGAAKAMDYCMGKGWISRFP